MGVDAAFIIIIFAGVPLAVFVVLSIFDTLRFHWTGPLWLGITTHHSLDDGRRPMTAGRRTLAEAAWKPTIAICLFLYGFALHYLVLGIPGFHIRASTRDSPSTISGARQHRGLNKSWTRFGNRPGRSRSWWA